MGRGRQAGRLGTQEQASFLLPKGTRWVWQVALANHSRYEGIANTKVGRKVGHGGWGSGRGREGGNPTGRGQVRINLKGNGNKGGGG